MTRRDGFGSRANYAADSRAPSRHILMSRRAASPNRIPEAISLPRFDRRKRPYRQSDREKASARFRIHQNATRSSRMNRPSSRDAGVEGDRLRVVDRRMKQQDMLQMTMTPPARLAVTPSVPTSDAGRRYAERAAPRARRDHIRSGALAPGRGSHRRTRGPLRQSARRRCAWACRGWSRAASSTRFGQPAASASQEILARRSRRIVRIRSLIRMRGVKAEPGLGGAANGKAESSPPFHRLSSMSAIRPTSAKAARLRRAHTRAFTPRFDRACGSPRMLASFRLYDQAYR